MTLAAPRLERIMARLEAEHRVSVADLAGVFGVSEETIRRDLRELEQNGRCARIYGGAILRQSGQDRPIIQRARMNQREKQSIAEIAARLVSPGMSMFLDTGTTTSALAQRLASMRGLKVFTNSLDIATLLGKSGEHEVFVTGGTVRANDNALIGYAADEAARRHAFDIAFMGIAAIDAEHGLMDFAQDEAGLRRTLVRQARRNIILADHSKFGRRALIRTVELEAIQVLITDRAPPAAFASMLDAARIEVLYE
jgi:DeoR family glycerol-3-phosphate regulon repressor